jgi:hypothetical protein
MSDLSATDPEEPLEDEGPVEDSEEDGIAPEVIWTSDAALNFDEARRLTSQRGATMVMFAGDTDAGKTTVMVEIWTSLLTDGRLGDLVIAGANNPLAFERRSFDSRIESGTTLTRRTDEETEGFLHLGVTCQRTRQELLFADYSGEHFRSIRDGAEVTDELPWIGRVDRLAVFVDGRLVSVPADAEVAYQRARRLLWKLRDCAALNGRLRAAVVLTKADLVDPVQADAFEPRLKELHDLIRELDPDAPIIRTSARPATGTEALGLDLLLKWVCDEGMSVPVREVDLERPDRAFGRFR